MTVFRVGMRVRLARPDFGSIKRGLRSGAQGVISAPCAVVGWRVDFPGYVNPYQGTCNFPAFPDELDPAIDHKHEACESEFKESLYRMLEKVVEVVR